MSDNHTAQLELPPGVTLDTWLAPMPDAPLPSVTWFTKLQQSTPGVVTQAMDWIEPQRTCAMIVKHHGAEGLQTVTKGIAQAASAMKLPMRPRIAAVAAFYDMKVY